jgi:hypothetical protein
VPFSYAQYAGNGSATTFSVPFPYLLKAHVKLYTGFNIIDGTFASQLVDGTDYTWTSNTQVQTTVAPAAGVTLTMLRDTPDTSQLVVWQDGSNLIADDQNVADLQNLYVVQEQQDRNDAGIIQSTNAINAATAAVATANTAAAAAAAAYPKDGSAAMTGDVAAGGFKLTNVGTPTSGTDGATKGYVDGFVSQTANIANGAVTTAKLADSSITSAKITDGTIVAVDLASDAITTAKILDGNVTTPKIADSSVTTAKLVDQSVTTAKVADSAITTGKLNAAAVTEDKIAASAVTASKIQDGEITSAKLNPSTVVTNAEVAGVSPNDTSFYTTSASDLRYFRQDSSETINSGMTWSGSDGFVATTAAIDARIIDLVDDVGGFVPIANETSFPAANPDINNPDGAGTIISVKEIVTSRTPSAGTVTIANGSGSSTVTITGCGSTVLAAGFGVLVETTATLHTYAFHRLVPKATEVSTVASISANVTTVAGISANVTTVAGIAADVTKVAGIDASVSTVASNINTILAVDIQLNGVFGIGVPGQILFGVGPVVPPGTAFAGISSSDYFPIHIRSGSFC